MSAMASTPTGTKKKRTKGGRYSHEITKQEIEQYYHLPCEEASRQLGIGLTILKRICRRLGIEKWPYRFLKRQHKLDEAAAAAAATDSGPGNASASGGTIPSPVDTATPHVGDAQAPPAAVGMQNMWGRNAHAAARGSGGSTHSHSSGDSGDSWGAQPGGAAPSLAPADWFAANGMAPMARQGSEPLAPTVPPKQQPGAAPPRHRAGAPPVGSTAAAANRRHASQDQKFASAAVAMAMPNRHSLELAPHQRQTSSPETSGGSRGGSASGLQRAASGALKRIREDDILGGMLVPQAGAAAAHNPFAAAAASMPAEASAFGGHGGSGDDGSDQLAAGLSKLRMRTLSLKRQCSRDDTALDALDQALLMERMAAQPQRPPMAGMARACSLPAAIAAQRRSPPILPPWQQGMPGLPPLGALQEAGWLAQEQMRLPRIERQAAGAGRAALQADAPLQPGDFDILNDPLGADGDLLLLSDPSFSAMLFGGTPRHDASASDLLSESCMLPELHQLGHSGSFGMLHKGDSSGLLLECAGAPGEMHLQHASSSGSARLHLGSSGVLASPLEQEASGIYGWQQQQQQQQPLAAMGLPGVTSVGPHPGAKAATAAAGSDKKAAPLPPSDSVGDMLSPFSAASDDHEVDDLLADFLGPAPTAELDSKELLVPFAPKQQPAASPQGGGGASQDVLAGLLLPAAAAAPPPAAMPPISRYQAEGQELGGSPLSLAAAGVNSSGSVVSHDTPTSSGATPSPAAITLELGSVGTTSASDMMQLLTARLLSDPDPAKQALAGQLLQKIQARQAARRVQQAQQAQQAAALLAWPGGPAPAPSPTQLEFENAVAKHVEIQQQYLAQRENVRTMLMHRQGDESDRLRQLARLKALKLQLAAAQQRQNELRQYREMCVAQRAAVQQQQQQQMQQMQAQQQQVFDGPSQLLGPPPLLPSSGHLQPMAQMRAQQPSSLGGGSRPAQHQMSPYGVQPAAVLQQRQQDTHASIAALYQQWSAEDAPPLPAQPAPAIHLAEHWLPAQPAWASTQALQPGLSMAQRAASAPSPLPWDADWATLL